MTNTKSMDLLETPFKMGTSARGLKNKVSDDMLSKVTTQRIIWHLVKRHKFGIVATWAVIITVLWAFPPATDILVSLVIGR